MDARRLTQRHAFTLVELLVVIGIIALLMSVLLPAIAGARRSAKRIACVSNLRSIMQAVMVYATQHSDAFPGSANTSGAFLLDEPYNNDHCPDIIQTWDWMSPLGRTLGIAFNLGPTPTDRFERYEKLANYGTFRCPENDLLSTSYSLSGGPSLAAHTMNSYVLASGFHYLHNATGDNRAEEGVGTTIARTEYNVPPGYGPRLSKIVNASRKIYLADGARYSTTSAAPNTNFDYNGGFGGAFADVGAWSRYSYSWNRGKAPGNGTTGRIDPRIFAYRHGNRAPGGEADTYKFNAAFFDGHVETLGDLEGANPALWLPSGTIIDSTGYELYRDVKARYCPGIGPTMAIP